MSPALRNQLSTTRQKIIANYSVSSSFAPIIDDQTKDYCKLFSVSSSFVPIIDDQAYKITANYSWKTSHTS